MSDWSPHALYRPSAEVVRKRSSGNFGKPGPGVQAALRLMLGAIALLLGLAPAAQAQDKKVESSVTLTWADFQKITGYDSNKKSNQTLTIPWSEVEALTGVKVERMGGGTTVELPWTEFKALLQWSAQRDTNPKELPPPMDFLVSSSEYMGEVTEDGAHLKLKVRLEVLKEKQWKRIPLLPSGVAVTRYTLPDGVFLNPSPSGYELVTRKNGTIDVQVEFSVAVRKNQGARELAFGRVLPGAAVLDLTVHQENVQVQVGGAQSNVVKPNGDKTQVAAALAPGSSVSLTWERALPKVEAAPPRIYVETLTLVAVAEGVLLGQEQVTFNILHSPVRELKLKVPAGASVLQVGGPTVQDWRSADGTLVVTMKGEVIGTQVMNVSFERPVMSTVEAPVIRPIGAEREKGFIGVVALSNLEITADAVTGARPVDARLLPGDLVAMTSQPVLLGFRYVEDQFAIPLTVRKHSEVGMVVTIVDSGLFTVMQLDDGRRMSRVVYTVRNNRNQFLRLGLPEGAELWSVEVNGKAATPARDEKGAVLLPLVRSESNSVELTAFPIELVYVENPGTAATPQGELTVRLPTVDAPIMHEMVSLYLPSEGKYTQLFGDSFSGPLKPVDGFTHLVSQAAAPPRAVDAAGEANAMQQQLAAREDEQARASGAQPIRVRLPINGSLFRFEKLLVLPGDKLWLTVQYRGWETAK